MMLIVNLDLVTVHSFTATAPLASKADEPSTIGCARTRGQLTGGVKVTSKWFAAKICAA